MESVALWGGLALGAIVPSITIISFWMRFSDRVTKAEAKSASATTIAQEARVAAHDCSEKLALQSAQFSLYREQVAKEYIHRESMREVEDRLTQAIDRLGARLDRFTEAAMQNKT